MKYFLWLITLPLTLVAVVFAIANRHAVMIDLWPLEFEPPLELPLFLILLATLLTGFVLGGAVTWLSAAGARGRARRERMRAEFLELENRRLQQLVNESNVPRDRPKVPMLPAA